MSSFSAGDTFLLGGLGGLNAKLHLYVVLCDPAGDPMTILAVPFNTVTSMTDSTLILEPGDHPFINRKTAISFDLMLEIEVDKLEKLDQLNSSGQAERFRRNTAALIDLLNRIIEGALKSDITPKKMLKSLKARLGINLIAESV